ncbi:MAG: TGS domain-containing protein [Candidatus Tritonobacter lacicola]|nr:TGS domain-containing protein [Candidatus Tritonobacter lacicola]
MLKGVVIPANLPPQYVAAEQNLKKAKDPEEKIAILEEMWALLPKHKGTDKIQADIKRRLSKLKKDAEKKGKGKKGFSMRVERMGAGQVAVIGPPNSGKSSLVSLLTNAEPKVAPYPFTTAMPYPAMMPYLDIQVQLVDLPPIAPGHLPFWVVNIVRNADAEVFVIDASAEDCLDRMEEVVSELDRRMIGLAGGEGRRDAPAGYLDKRVLLVSNRMDCDNAPANLDIISEFYADRFDVFPFSCAALDEGEVEKLRKAIFDLLGVIRVYSKQPGSKPDMGSPFTVRACSTILDFAAHVHKDFAKDLKQARVWGSARFDGQAVSRDHVLRDADIVELSL